MCAERRLSQEDVDFILAWAEKWKAIPSRREIAAATGVSQATVVRIIRYGGYKPRKKTANTAALAASFKAKSFVPRGTEQNESIKEDGCTRNQP